MHLMLKNAVSNAICDDASFVCDNRNAVCDAATAIYILGYEAVEKIPPENYLCTIIQVNIFGKS